MSIDVDRDGKTDITAGSVPKAQRQATGKDHLLEVPDYDLETAGNQKCYLRLGAADPDWEDPSKGGDLAAMVDQVGPGENWDTKTKQRLFEDDWRERGNADGHELSPAERAAESAKLHHRGGWRDHSAGNRISTVR